MKLKGANVFQGQIKYVRWSIYFILFMVYILYDQSYVSNYIYNTLYGLYFVKKKHERKFYHPFKINKSHQHVIIIKNFEINISIQHLLSYIYHLPLSYPLFFLSNISIVIPAHYYYKNPYWHRVYFRTCIYSVNRQHFIAIL